MTNTPLSIEPLVERTRVLLKALGAIGASAVGATALMVVSGASYYQSLLEGIHAHWAAESVGYSAMAFAGAHNLQLLVMTTLMTCGMVVGGVLSWRSLWIGVGLSILGLACSSILPGIWPSLRGGRTGFWLALAGAVATAYFTALLCTALFAWQAQKVEARRWLLMLTGAAVLCITFFLPAHLGSQDADDILNGAGRTRHPDVCLKDDPTHAWRLARTLGDSFLLMSPDRGTFRFRLANQADILSILVSVPEQPAEGGPPALACRS